MVKPGTNRKPYPRRGEIYWVILDPTIGSEINKTRPAVIISNDEANEMSRRIIVAPITSSVTKVYPFEVRVAVKEKEGKVLLDQVRAIDKQRLADQIGQLDSDTMEQVDIALKIALGLS